MTLLVALAIMLMAVTVGGFLTALVGCLVVYVRDRRRHSA